MPVSKYVMMAFMAFIILDVKETGSIPATLPVVNKTTSVHMTTTVVHPTNVTLQKPSLVSATTTRHTTNLPSAANSTVNTTATPEPTVFNASATVNHTIKVRQVPTEATSISPSPIMTGRRVAFSVTKATENLHAFAHIHFRDVLTNVGGGWDPATSEFVAPHDGKYFFIFHAIGVKDGDFTMSLTKNGMRQVTAYGTQTSFEHGSNSVILELKTMDKITLELHQGAIYENPGNETYTTFTGFLLSSV